MKKEAEIKAGKVLLAEPYMEEPTFKRSVILVCDEHKTEGTIGLMLNKKLDVQVDNLLTDFPEFKANAYFGGPVQTDTLHYLHDLGELVDGASHVHGRIYWGGDFEKVKFLIRSEVATPDRIRFFVGYTGWSAGQLKGEIDQKDWLLANMDNNYLFNADPESLWQSILEHEGNTYSVIAQLPTNPPMN